MKNFVLKKAWPVFGGLFVAFATMGMFEYVNSLFFPLPEGLDILNPAAVREFTDSLPWTAYVLVLAGWVVGAFAAGATTTWLARAYSYRTAFATGAILTLIGVLNNFMIGHSVFFSLVGLPTFIIFTYIGHRYAASVRTRRALTSTPLETKAADPLA